MSNDQVPPCKQRFKGIENFLRRVAFNLGNTPSQTEVKIISCIPIDVSDLQQKISSLEKQLEEARGAKPSPIAESQPPVSAAYCTHHRRTYAHAPARHQETPRDRATSPCELATRTVTIRNRSTTSFVNQRTNDHNDYYGLSHDSLATLQMSNHDCQPLIICEPQEKEPRKNFFKKRCLMKKKKLKTQCVYYAQINASPFQNNNRTHVLDDMEVNARNGVTRSYLADVIEKQYKPRNLGNLISDISEYSSPICRDDVQSHKPCAYDSEAYSSCLGQFYNLDKQRNDDNTADLLIDTLNANTSRNAYYDSSLYDLVPVKEKPVKIKKELKEQNDWPEKLKDNFHYQPYTVNYHTITPTRNFASRKKYKNHVNKSDASIRKVSTKRKKEFNFGQQVNIKSSRSCCVEFGNVYAKKPRFKPKPLKIIRASQPLRKNAECLTIAINNTECQTEITESNSEAKDDIVDVNDAHKAKGKAEVTLNQIKSILQSVLLEVKNNNQVKTTSDEKEKKDAIVQKGVSQTNLKDQSLLNSFSYNPYVMNPYSTSYSQQIRCIQNYPLLIQPGHHMCSTCYRPTVKPGPSKQASPHDDRTHEQRSHETEKLIKEIYKSMAINFDVPAQDTTKNEYNNLKSIDVLMSPSKEKKSVERRSNMVQASVLFQKKEMQSDISKNLDTDASKFTSTTVSMHSQHASTNTEETKSKGPQTPTKRSGSLSVSTATEHRTPPEEESDTESESSQSTVTGGDESDVTFVPEEPVKDKKEQKSLFSKVVKLFKKEKAPKKAKPASDAESESDSDDYQTIYSKNIEKPQYTRPVLPKYKTHSKVSQSKQAFRREKSPKRTPYMEQEYKRQWTEKLIFQDRKDRKYSSERPATRETPPEIVPYYLRHPAKSAIVNQNEYVPREKVATRQQNVQAKLDPTPGAKRMAWLNKQRNGIGCGIEWKKLILES